jgi:C4-type Zn-finger protein
MSNLPIGTQNHPDAPWNQKEVEPCPVCGTTDEYQVSTYTQKVKGHRYTITDCECRECGFTDSDEPDFDED